jgi:hypothetical protein
MMVMHASGVAHLRWGLCNSLLVKGWGSVGGLWRNFCAREGHKVFPRIGHEVLMHVAVFTCGGLLAGDRLRKRGRLLWHASQALHARLAYMDKVGRQFLTASCAGNTGVGIRGLLCRLS